MRSNLISRGAQRIKRISSQVLYSILGRWDTDFRPIFICGAAGSGTSLIAGLLDQSYETANAFRESARSVEPDSPLFVKPSGAYTSVSDFYEGLHLPSGISPRQVREESLKLYRAHVRHPKAGPIIIDKTANAHLVNLGLFAAAFDQARFVLILRDPVEVIEGFRRKWKLYRTATVQEMTDFLSAMHGEFVEQSRELGDRVAWISFAQLTSDPEQAVAKVAKWAALTPRREKFTYPDESNKKGRGLRNIVGGEIVVDKPMESTPTNLSQAEIETIKVNCQSWYPALVERCEVWWDQHPIQ